MEYKYNDLKEYLIRNGNKKEVGVAKNKRIVYEYRLGRQSHKTKDAPIKNYSFTMNYDGLSAYCKLYSFPSYNCIRYNETTDCIQAAYDDIYGYAPKYKTLKFDEYGNLKTCGNDIVVFLNVGEDKEYAKTYYKEHINDAIKIIESNIKEWKSFIKSTERKIKKYEKELNRLNEELNG